MAIRVTCPSCESSYTVDDAMRGKKVRCRDCEATVAVPSTSGKDSKSSSSGAGKKEESISSRPMPRVAARASDRDRDDDDRPRRKDPAKKSGMLLPLLIGGGVLAVLGVFGVIAVVVIFFVLGSSSPAPVAKANAPAAAEAIAPPAIAPPPIAPPPPAQVAPPPVVVAPAMEGSIPLAVLEQIKDATVFVKMDAGAASGTGSGFLMRVDGDNAFFATNDHVVTPPSSTVVTIGRLKPKLINTPKARISVVLRSGTPREQILQAEVVTADAEADLAVVRVTGARDLPKPIDFSKQIALVETMPLYILGFPFGNALAGNKGNPAITVSKGAISSLRRDDKGEVNVVQINGDLNPGNSGGPVVDAQGRLIGVSVAAIKGTQIGMAIPAADLTQLIAGRALGTLVFKKNVVGNNADVHGEIWILDRNHKIRATRTLNVRVNNVAIGGEPGDFEIEAKLLDPLRKITTVSLLYARTDNPAPTQPNAQGRWDPLPRSGQIQLKIEDQKAVGGLMLPPGAQAQDMFCFQLALVNGAGQVVYTQPRSFRLNFNPGGIALGPPVGPPIGQPPVGQPPVGQPPVVLPPVGQHEEPPAGWKYVSAKDGTFKVLFPTASVRSGSRERTFTRNNVTGKLQINYSTLKDNTTLQVASIGLSGAGLKGLKPNDICDLIIATENEKGSTVTDPKEVMVGTLKGREYIITASRGTRRLVLSVVGGRVLLLSVDAADADKTKSETANTFLKSLVMTTPQVAKDTSPAKGEESKPGDPSAVKWTLDLKAMNVPEAAVTGQVRGKEFRPDKVTLEVGFLTFRQGKGFFADREVKLALFPKFGESMENRTFEIPALDTIRVGIPHIHVSSKEPGDKLPKTEIVSSNYALKLTFGKAANGVIPGRIYLSVSDAGKTVLAGTFQVKAE